MRSILNSASEIGASRPDEISRLIPGIASKFGVHSADMLLPLQTMTGFGRTLSPVTGAIVAVAGIAGVSPFQIVKRNAIPLVLCILLNYVLTFTIVI